MPELFRLMIGWTVVLASLVGWSTAIMKKLRLQPELSFPLAISGIILLVYTSGLCGSLLVGAIAVAAGGCALFVWLLAKDRRCFSAYATPGFAFLALFAVFIALQVRDDPLSHNDDFNHWAVIARNMLLRDRFPDATVTAIDFSSYPPGTAVFIYYVNRLSLGAYREGRLIFSQNLLVLSFLTPLFAPLSGRKEAKPLWPMLCAAALLIFLYEFRALIVDVVNGVVGFAALAGVLALYKAPKKAALYAAPVTCLGLLVKYSNVFYFAITAVALLGVALSARKDKRKTCIGTMLAGAGFCVAMVAAWFLHVRYAFGGVADTHSMNAGRIFDVLHSWSAEDIRTIARVCLYMATSLRKSSVLLTVFMNVFVLALLLAQRMFFKRSPKRLLTALVLADVAYIGYQCMLFCAYILSFPREEALRGASYGRYNMSIMIWVIGVLATVAVQELLSLGNGKRAKGFRTLVGIGFACVTVAALAITGEGSTLFTEVPYEGTRQAAADTILSDNAFSQDDTFFVLAADEDARQVASVFHYKVNRRVDYVHVDSVESTQSLAQACSGHSYLIILEEDPRILSLTGGLSIGAYPVEEGLFTSQTD